MDPTPSQATQTTIVLSPFAVPLTGGAGREHDEKTDETRGPFQRDRDRIIHSDAFRRLQGKTQVFVAGEGDHYRTRLTHTLEVTQISRDIARTLGLNEDLSECIALSHDIGHPPFGHSGEEAIDEWLQTLGLHFEHNEQSLRVVTMLERHSGRYPGLNLNREVLEGIQKHSRPDVPEYLSHTLEAQVVNLSDEIAYSCHDCDDGIRAGLFSTEDLATTAFGKRAKQRAQERGTQVRNAMVHILVSDLYTTSRGRLAEHSIRTLDDVRRTPRPIIALSDPLREELNELRGFIWDRLICHPDVRTKAQAGQKVIRVLCERLMKDPTDKVLQMQERTGSSVAIAVKDYVAGMTDEFAILQAQCMEPSLAFELPL